jgi:hypothetical protein
MDQLFSFVPIIGHVSLGPKDDWRKCVTVCVRSKDGTRPCILQDPAGAVATFSFVAFIPESTFDAPNTLGSASTWPTYKNTENRNHGRIYSNDASQP